MERGFSLLELLITVTIMTILTAIAIPTYQNYTRKAYYSEVVMSAQPYKLGVIACFNETIDLTQCNAGNYGVPFGFKEPHSGIQEIKVEQGKITVLPTQSHGLTSEDSYILTPSVDYDRLSWAVSGGGVEKGYVNP
jgi:type IV pilus assembly protein PilA